MTPITRLNGSGCVRFTLRDHYPILKEWYRLRGKQAPKKGMLPTIGYVSDDRVIGFLYQTDSNVAMIEGIISDPNTIPSFRKLALKRLCAKLTDKAFELGYTNVFGISKHPSIKAISLQLGYKDGGPFNILTLTEQD